MHAFTECIQRHYKVRRWTHCIEINWINHSMQYSSRKRKEKKRKEKKRKEKKRKEKKRKENKIKEKVIHIT